MQVFDTEIWTTDVLQAAHEEPFVYRALIAIGALSKALNASQPKEPNKGVKALPNVNDSAIQSK